MSFLSLSCQLSWKMNNLKYNVSKEKAAGSQHIIFSDVIRVLKNQSDISRNKRGDQYGNIKAKKTKSVSQSKKTDGGICQICFNMLKIPFLSHG